MKILLLGAQGQLGWELGASLATLGKVIHLGRSQADLTKLDNLTKVVRQVEPQIIVNAAAHTQVDQAESEPELAHLINAEAPIHLAKLAKDSGSWLVHYSTDYVFDGKKDGPYLEDDSPNPLNVYGASKLAGDEGVMKVKGHHLIFRISWVFAAHGRNFARTILDVAAQKDAFPVVSDQFGSPTSVELVASATTLALQQALKNKSDLSGLYNLVSGGTVNWHGYAVYVIKRALEMGWALKAKPENIATRNTEASERPALRPANSRLDTTKFQKIFALEPSPWQYYVDRVLWAWTREAAKLHEEHKVPPKLLGARFLTPGSETPGSYKR